jgi:uncharacterized membrane protein required for colicin V production
MLLVDIVLILIIIGFTLGGMRSGFVQALGQLIGAVLGFMAARAWSPWLAGFFGIFTSRTGLVHFIAFVLIFLIVDRMVGLLFKFAGKLCQVLTHLPLIRQLNSFLGAILGFLEGIVLVGSSVYVVMSTRLDLSLVHWLTTSTVANYTERAFSRVLGYLL